jgi:hypothetical protein
VAGTQVQPAGHDGVVPSVCPTVISTVPVAFPSGGRRSTVTVAVKWYVSVERS